MESRRLTTVEAAEFIRANPKALERWRQLGIGPAFLRLNPRCIRYELTDLVTWLNRQRVETTDAGGANDTVNSNAGAQS
jgi:hypothetical protein